MVQIGLVISMLLAVAACETARQPVGAPKVAETRWLLIRNPGFSDVRSEPEYVWVEEDRVPITLISLMRGRSAIIATPEIAASYGPPPDGGKISLRQIRIPIIHPGTGEVLGVLEPER